jgi:hypothetical protein
MGLSLSVAYRVEAPGKAVIDLNCLEVNLQNYCVEYDTLFV